jgi:hypothetical protein
MESLLEAKRQLDDAFNSIVNEMSANTKDLLCGKERLNTRQAELDKRQGELSLLARSIEDQQKNFKEEELKVAQWKAAASDIVSLNVGGELFQTTRSTLTSEPSTMLEAMFSGRHHATRGKGFKNECVT